MDPLKSASSQPHDDISISAPIRGPVSSQNEKIPDLKEKGKAIFKAVVQTGSSTFDKVKNYFGGTSKLSASKYKEAVLNELPNSALKEQIKEMNSVNDIRKALLGDATTDGNSIDAVASFKGKTATIGSDLGKLQNVAERAVKSAKENLSEIASSFDETSKIKKQILKNIDNESKANKSQELQTLRAEVANAKTIDRVRDAVDKYNLSSLSHLDFEGSKPKNAERYKQSVLSQLDNARNFAELNDLETRDYDRLRKAIELTDSPSDIQETISEYNLDNFDPDEVHDSATTASRYASSIAKLEEAAQKAAEKIKSLFKSK